MRRRQFLERAGAAAAGWGALPLIPLLEREAEAAGAPRRFVVFYSPNGMTGRYPEPFAPIPGTSGREDDFAWSPILEPLSGGYEEHGVPISDLKSQVIVTQGLDLVGSGADGGSHSTGAAIMLTAAYDRARTLGAGVSIDQLLAPSLGGELPFPSLQLGVQGANNDGVAPISYRSAGAGLPQIIDPLQTYARLFGAAEEDPLERQIRLRRQGSILDRLREDLAALQTRVSKADRTKLEAHLEAVRGIERRLNAPVVTCGPERPELNEPEGALRFGEEGRLQIELLAAALRCDQTRVATLMWGPNPNNFRFRFLPGQASNDWPMHEATHDDPSHPESHGFLIEVARYYARQFAYLAQLLADTPEGDGTMLDHTQLVWVSETSNPYEHSFVNMPFVLAGGGAGFRTGRYVRFDSEPHAKLWVTIAQAMGRPEVSRFGSDEYGASGTLSNLA